MMTTRSDRRHDALDGRPAAVPDLAAHDGAAAFHFISTADYLIDRYGLMLTTANVSEVLHCHPSHVRAMCAEQILPAVKINDRWRVHAAKLAAFIEGEGA